MSNESLCKIYYFRNSTEFFFVCPDVGELSVVIIFHRYHAIFDVSEALLLGAD